MKVSLLSDSSSASRSSILNTALFFFSGSKLLTGTAWGGIDYALDTLSFTMGATDQALSLY
jgi:hypothetical protein